MKETAKTKDEWVRCTKCGHKLFKTAEPNKRGVYIEIKCHSCKEIQKIEL